MAPCHHSHHLSHCSERRAGIMQGTFASSDYCPTVVRRSSQLFLWATRDGPQEMLLLPHINLLARGGGGSYLHIAASCQIQEFPALQLAPELNFLWIFLCYISVSWASTSWSSQGEKNESSISFSRLTWLQSKGSTWRDHPNWVLLPPILPPILPPNWVLLPKSELTQVCTGCPATHLGESPLRR